LAKVNEYQKVRQNREGIESSSKEADMSATNTDSRNRLQNIIRDNEEEKLIL